MDNKKTVEPLTYESYADIPEGAIFFEIQWPWPVNSYFTTVEAAIAYHNEEITSGCVVTVCRLNVDGTNTELVALNVG